MPLLFWSIAFRPILVLVLAFAAVGLSRISLNKDFPNALHLLGGHALGDQPCLCLLGFRLARKPVQLAPPLPEFGRVIVDS